MIASAVVTTRPNSPSRLARAVRCILSASKPARAGVAVASETNHVSNPRLLAHSRRRRAAVIDPQADDDDVIGPAFRRSSCRSVPMNALLTCLSRTTSPGNGRASGLELERCCAAAEKPSGRSALVAHVYDGCAELTPYGQELANVGLGIRVVALSPRGVVESLLHGHAAGRSCRDQRN